MSIDAEQLDVLITDVRVLLHKIYDVAEVAKREQPSADLMMEIEDLNNYAGIVEVHHGL